MDTGQFRELYLRFFEERGHKRIPSAPLLPENDPSVLFTTAGMHPLVPYLLGEPHPLGKRLTNFQKCIRTNDIDEVGNSSHLTFFEMLGNWSLGDYFRAESLAWSHEFLTHELSIPESRLAVTVFAGDADAPRDDIAAGLWRKLGLPEERIFFLPKQDNWWGPAGATWPVRSRFGDLLRHRQTRSRRLPSGLRLWKMVRNLEQRLYGIRQNA